MRLGEGRRQPLPGVHVPFGQSGRVGGRFQEMGRLGVLPKLPSLRHDLRPRMALRVLLWYEFQKTMRVGVRDPWRGLYLREPRHPHTVLCLFRRVLLLGQVRRMGSMLMNAHTVAKWLLAPCQSGLSSLAWPDEHSYANVYIKFSFFARTPSVPACQHYILSIFSPICPS